MHSPAPEARQADDLYRGQAGITYHSLVNLVSKAAFEYVTKTRKFKIQRYLKPSDTVLEFGVGTGWNLCQLNCHRKIGYDISTHLEPSLKDLGIEFIADLALLPDCSVDVILCHHALEHLAEPLKAIIEMKRLLKKTGKLLVFVPWEADSRFFSYKEGDVNHHLYSWNCQTLGNIFAEHGFCIKFCCMQTFGYEKISSELAARIGGKQKLFLLIRRLFHMIRHDREIFLLAEKN